MSVDLIEPQTGTETQTTTEEARRQVEICNACRYCEGFCSVFPAIARQTAYADGDLTHLANLCHNCRACYYSCQYTAPHEFSLNLPAILAEVRQESWERTVGPLVLSRAFHAHGVAIVVAMIGGIAALFALIAALPTGEGAGFYAHLSHNLMIAIFAPAFLLPLLAVAVAMRRYWAETAPGCPTLGDMMRALAQAAMLRNLDGGQQQGCNFEVGDRYSDLRRMFHQAVLYGFLACFAATSFATLMHYFLGMEAPYGFFSLPKLLAVPGGVALAIGAVGLAWLKTRSDPALGAVRVWGGEMAFVLLLGFVATSGLALYAATGTGAVSTLLALHLGAVLTFFLILPYTKMVHGFFRMAALIAEEMRKRG